MVLNMIKIICRLARLITWNFVNVFSKLFTERCLLFNKLTCVRIEQNHLSASPSACDSHKVYLRTISCCNKCQVNLFYFQRFDIMFILSSSPKVGIYSIRCNLHIFSFLRYVPVLWITDKNCNKIIEPATNNYVVHTRAIY